jgi:hypothetical protein
MGNEDGNVSLLGSYGWENEVTRPGKHTKSHGKSPFLMGKSTIFVGHVQ